MARNADLVPEITNPVHAGTVDPALLAFVLCAKMYAGDIGKPAGPTADSMRKMRPGRNGYDVCVSRNYDVK